MQQLSARIAFVCGLSIVLSSAVLPANGTLMLTVAESGGPPIPIVDGGPLDANLAPNAISANTAALNVLLVQYQFTTLGASDNAGIAGPPGTAAFITQTGEVVRTQVGGAGNITMVASDTDFLVPGGNPKSMTTAASDTFLFTAAGNSRTFQSTFDSGAPINSPLLVFIPPVGAGPFGTSNPGVNTPLGAQATPFSLSNTTVITMAVAGGNMGQDQFTGATTVTAVVPEPASLALLAAGALLLRRRPARA